METYRRYINRHVLPRWETVRASDMEPIAVQNWLRELHKDSNLSNSTLVKVRNVMVAIFKHAQRYGFLPRTQEANPMVFVRQTSVSDYEPVVLTFSQCVDILANLNGIHRVLVLADAATGLRISEIPAPQNTFCWHWRNFGRSVSSSSLTKKTSTRPARWGRRFSR